MILESKEKFKGFLNVVFKRLDAENLFKLLEDILPKDTFFKGFEVTHEFPMIGRKMMILNARQIHPKAPTGKVALKLFEPIILLAMEDVTDMMAVAEKLALHTQQFETELKERTSRLEVNFKDIEKWMEDFKKRV